MNTYAHPHLGFGKLCEELLSICSEMELNPYQYEDMAASTMTGEDAVVILRAIVEKKKAEAATAAASRPNTTQSAKSDKYPSYDAMRKRIHELGTQKYK